MDPQRPYAQHFTSMAKSIKLLRRAQHHKLVNTLEFRKSEAILKVWQKCTAKGIVVCPAAFMTDMFMFLRNGKYIGIVVDYSGPIEFLDRLCIDRIVDGILSVHTKGKLVGVKGQFFSMMPSLFDYCGENVLDVLSQPQEERVITAAKCFSCTKVGQAANFLHLAAFGFPELSWHGFDKEEIAIILNMLITLYRNRGQLHKVEKLTRGGRYQTQFDYIQKELELQINELNSEYYVTWHR